MPPPKTSHATAKLFRQALTNQLNTVFRGRTAKSCKLGLCVSGGVDSMALARLCTQFKTDLENKVRIDLVAFIVDHKVRKGSTKEAKAVATELDRIGIPAHVLTLDWQRPDDGDNAVTEHFERVARQMRYQIIAKACRTEGVEALLTGHHADDNVETILSRIILGYRGLGLRGILPIKSIPECDGIYGISGMASAEFVRRPMSERAIALETGRIPLLRPLLNNRKRELKAVCKEMRVKVFEDATNAEIGLALRNTVRHLQRKNVLPEAFKTASLLGIAGQLRKNDDLIETATDRLLQRITISLDLRNASLKCTIPFSLNDHIAQNWPLLQTHLKRRILFKILALLTKSSQEQTASVLDALAVLFPDNSSASIAPPSAVMLHQLWMKRIACDDENFTVEIRACKSPRSAYAVPFRLEPISIRNADATRDDSNGWHLWEKRYWIRVAQLDVPSKSALKFQVKPLTADGLGRLRKQLKTEGSETLLTELETALYVGGLATKYCIPAIVVTGQGSSDNSDGSPENERVVALPSLGWSLPDWHRWSPSSRTMQQRVQRKLDLGHDCWLWDIRYKGIPGFPYADCHKIEDSWPQAQPLTRRIFKKGAWHREYQTSHPLTD